MNECHESFLIREARQDEVDVIVAFQQEMALETEGLVLDPRILQQGIRAVFKNSYLGRYYVAEHMGEVVASLLITPEWSDWRNVFIWWIQSVYVMPFMRGKGCYSAMYAHMKQLVQTDPGVGGVRLYVERQNQKAIAVYRILGMDDEHYRMFEWMK